MNHWLLYVYVDFDLFPVLFFCSYFWFPTTFSSHGSPLKIFSNFISSLHVIPKTQQKFKINFFPTESKWISTKRAMNNEHFLHTNFSSISTNQYHCNHENSQWENYLVIFKPFTLTKIVQCVSVCEFLNREPRWMNARKSKHWERYNNFVSSILSASKVLNKYLFSKFDMWNYCEWIMCCVKIKKDWIWWQIVDKDCS